MLSETKVADFTEVWWSKTLLISLAKIIIVIYCLPDISYYMCYCTFLLPFISLRPCKKENNSTGIPKGATSPQKLAQPSVTPESTSIPQQRPLPVKTLVESENPGKNSENSLLMKYLWICPTSFHVWQPVNWNDR